MLRKIECFIQPFKLDEVKDALFGVGVEGMSISEVRGFGKQRGYVNGGKLNRGVKFLPKIKMEIVVDEEIVDNVIKTIVKLSKTGEFGSGKIFVIPVEDAIRIRTEESGKSAIISIKELENLTRIYTYELLPFIGPEKDIPAPDVGTNAQIMSWIMDTYSVAKGYMVPGVVTGKPIELGGSQGRTEATSRGAVYTLLAALKVCNISASNLTVAVQGFGNVGSFAAKILFDLGFKIIALSDVTGAIYNKKGIDPYKLSDFIKTNALVSYPEAEKTDPDKFFETKCDILIPAALENQITANNAPFIKAKILAEGENAPTTPDADPALKENNIFVIPDVLCNSGGVTVSYFEWVQGNDAYFWSKRKVNLQLRDIMEKAFYEVYDFSLKRKLDMRDAALALAVGRVAEAMRLRGVYP